MIGVVEGRLIVDVHHHFVPKRFFDEVDRLLPAEMEAVWENGRVLYRYRETGHAVTPFLDPTWWYDDEKQLRAMDAAEIDHAVVSVACYQDWMTIDGAQIVNDGTAELVRRHPDRFSGMISIPPDGGDAMVREIHRARELGLCAINITTAHRGRYPDHEDFGLLFETAASLKLPVYIHPSWHTPLPHMERWDLERSIGKPTDLNLSIANLMFSGTFDRLPDLKVLVAHLGGSLPVTLRRLFHGQPGWLKVPDFDYVEALTRLFVDTGPAMWWTPVDIECAAKMIGSHQLLLGSDYPLSNDPAEVLRTAVHNVRGSDLPQSDKVRLMGGNAIKLFGLKHLERGPRHASHGEYPGCC